jgi:hypothetical protein
MANSLITVGGVDFTPYITEFQPGLADLDVESTRNTAGLLIRNRIAVKRKIKLSFRPLKQADISKILKAVSPVFVTVTYLDSQDGTVTKTMYASDRTAAVAVIIGGVAYWTGLSFDLVEQ